MNHERLTQYIKEKNLDTEDVINLGIDICRDLELYHKTNKMHGIIIPSNIYVTVSKKFILGDSTNPNEFSHDSEELANIYVKSFKAPEIFAWEDCDVYADIYSLGLILYWLLNDYRMPFMPPVSEPILPSQREKAEKMRQKGIPFPKPIKADDDFSKIIFKACAFNANDRYSSVREFKEDLVALSSGKPPIHALRITTIDPEPIVKPEPIDEPKPLFAPEQIIYDPQPNKTISLFRVLKPGLFIASGVIIVLFVIIISKKVIFNPRDDKASTKNIESTSTNNFPEQKLQEQLNLGQKYLIELEYEQAATAFMEALAILPDNEEAKMDCI